MQRKYVPASATHYLVDSLGPMYYKRCELTGKWLYWSDAWNSWTGSSNTPEQMKHITPLEN